MNLRLTTATKSAIIFGANSLVGQQCLSEVLHSPIYESVLAFSSEPITLKDDKLQSFHVDYSDTKSYEQLIIGSDLFCCLGTTVKRPDEKGKLFETNFRHSYEIARIALKNGVNQFIMLSSVGADDNALFFYNKFKGQLESVVSRMEFWSIHIFKPSFLLPNEPENNIGANLANKLGSFLDDITGGLVSKYRPIEANFVAEAMFKVAQETNKNGIFNYDNSAILSLVKPT